MARVSSSNVNTSPLPMLKQVSFGSGMVAAMSGLVDGASRETVVAAMNWVYGVNIGFALLAFLMVIPIFLNRDDSEE